MTVFVGHSEFDKNYPEIAQTESEFWILRFDFSEITSIEMLVRSLKFALMDCYGHRTLVKMWYYIVRKLIFGMNLTEFVLDISRRICL